MADRPFLNSQQWQDQQFRAHRDGAHPDLLNWEAGFLRRMRKLDIPMFAAEVWRRGERQDELYRAGRSKAKAGQSPHNFGCASDLVHSVQGWNLNDREWALLGHVGKELARQMGLKLVWGGDWKFYDPAHWEVENWRVIRGVFQSHPAVKTVPEALAILAKERAES